MEIKTTSQMNSKVWYRILKTLYLILLMFTLATIIIVAILNARSVWQYPYYFQFAFSDPALYLEIFGVMVAFEVVKRGFYYIVFGTVEPKK
jgi:hypothetical protein